MKRSAIKRVTPLGPSGSWKPVAGTKRAGSTRARNTGPSAATRALVADRAEHRCERCGRVFGWDRWSMHHRLPRSRGTDNSAANLIMLCGSGVSGCHGEVEAQRTSAYLAGLLLRTGQEPASEPVQLRDGWVYLDSAGRKVPA